MSIEENFVAPPFNIRTMKLIEDMSIEENFVAPSFSYRMLGITLPTWLTVQSEINLELAQYLKDQTNPSFYLQEYQRIVSECYFQHTLLFTDGSKSETRVGAAAICLNTTKKASLPPIASVFSAELHAIQLALQIITERSEEEYLILSDSLSSLQSIKDKSSKHPIVRKAQHQIHDIYSSGQSVKFMWMPSHIGIAGNERVDKRASERRPEDILVNYTDWYSAIRSKMYDKWKLEWTQCGGVLREVQDTPGPWPKISIIRRHEVIVNRLRTGHTYNCLMNTDIYLPNLQPDKINRPTLLNRLSRPSPGKNRSPPNV